VIRIAIIAGSGDLPEKVLASAKAAGKEPFLICLKGQAREGIDSLAPSIWISLGQVGKAVDFMKEHQITEIVMIGAVNRPSLSSLQVDKKGKQLLARIAKGKILGDNKILTIIVKFFEDEGFKVVGADELAADLLVMKGVLTNIKLTPQDEVDAKIAEEVLSSLSAYDIGQSIIVENGTVLGIEAVEGTDELIKRCSKLKKNQKSGILVKFAKVGQERKADLPTLGPQTIRNLAKAGFRGVIFKAESTLIVDRKKLIEIATAKGLILQAI
jgi:UDP-2,3-diacylglucosamine hydrolase